MKYITITALLVSVVSLFFALEAYSSLRSLECNSGKAFIAERNFTYPIFRELGKNPDNYGKNDVNPLLSSSQYRHCFK